LRDQAELLAKNAGTHHVTSDDVRRARYVMKQGVTA